MSRTQDVRLHELCAAREIFTTDLESLKKRKDELEAAANSTEAPVEAAANSTEAPGDDMLKEFTSVGDKMKKLTAELATLGQEIKKLEQVDSTE